MPETPEGTKQEDAKPIDPAEFAKLQKELAEVRKEAADRRVAARTAEERAGAAEARRAELEPYEQTVKEEVDSLKKELGDKATVVDGLNHAQALRVLRTLKAASAGPGAAKNTTSGAPKGADAGEPNVEAMNPQELETYMKTLPVQKIRELARKYGVTPQRSVFG